ncbi:alpha/beta-hydrolase [Lojkania enalia]|uniref:Alpha/beta-hydrolase n=1 Tax=Lojkania enalia TaxID=147567 RepID=A0A9P4JZ76_9PLEO|nr:alpha/beta-hydrolase [Didymosphaeria enalia]
MAYHTTPATRFDSFNIYTTSYKKIHDHEIEVNIIVPKDIKAGKYPLIVQFHGGGLVTGTAMYPDWIAAWFIPFIHRNNAITILPNYRLIPEHTGHDILEDLNDLWKWFNTSLTPYVASKEPSIILDFDHLLVTGDSAGGYMALQSAMTLPKSTIKAVLAKYPMTDILCGDLDAIQDPPPVSLIDEHMASVVPGTVVSCAVPPARGDLSTALRFYRRWQTFLGTGKELLPINRVEDATFFPPTYIMHGKDDTLVFCEDSQKFVRKLERVVPGVKVNLATWNGGHGFDVGLYEDDLPGLGKGLKWVERVWLG